MLDLPSIEQQRVGHGSERVDAASFFDHYAPVIDLYVAVESWVMSFCVFDCLSRILVPFQRAKEERSHQFSVVDTDRCTPKLLQMSLSDNSPSPIQ